MRTVFVVAVVAVLSLALGQQEHGALGVVLDLERPSDTDVLLLRNGDQLTGTILNESLSIRTSYGQLELNNRVIAGVDLEGGANNIESIITVNDNRFSGFIDDPVFAFRLQTGTVIEVRREKVLKALFRLREQERSGIPQRQFVTLKNGDFFTGLLQNEDLVAETTYAEVPLTIEDIESITFIGETNPLTTIRFRNGDTLQGILNQEDLRIALDVGGELEIYQDRIDRVWLREGFVPSFEDRSDTGSSDAADPIAPSTPTASPATATGSSSNLEAPEVIANRLHAAGSRNVYGFVVGTGQHFQWFQRFQEAWLAYGDTLVENMIFASESSIEGSASRVIEHIDDLYFDIDDVVVVSSCGGAEALQQEFPMFAYPRDLQLRRCE